MNKRLLFLMFVILIVGFMFVGLGILLVTEPVEVLATPIAPPTIPMWAEYHIG